MKNSLTYAAAALIIIAGITLAVWYGANQRVSVLPSSTPTIAPTMAPATSPSATPMAHADWKAAVDASAHASFQYPPTIPTKYISLVDWPPKIQVVHEPFACTQAGSQTARAGKTEQKIINGITYCVTTESEGAAGSVYTQYAYAWYKGDATVILTFSLRFVQCANYDQPKQQECQAERDTFTPDTILDQIAQTVTFQ